MLYGSTMLQITGGDVLETAAHENCLDIRFSRCRCFDARAALHHRQYTFIAGRLKMQDMKLKDQIATHESARHENDGPICRT